MNKATIFDTDAPHPEASNLTAFSQNALDRQAEKRDDDCVSTALAIEGTHILAFTTGKLVLKHDDQVLDPLFAAYELAELKPDFDNAILLGYKQNGEPRIAVPLQTTEEELASHFKPVDARALYRDQLLDEDLLGETAQAVSLLRWNDDNRFCGRCASRMDLKIGGYKRVCSSCGHMIFPRTDPVVIMLTIDLERDLCLLGRGPHHRQALRGQLGAFGVRHRDGLEERGVRGLGPVGRGPARKVLREHPRRRVLPREARLASHPLEGGVEGPAPEVLEVA